jgi:hypothetical protein
VDLRETRNHLRNIRTPEKSNAMGGYVRTGKGRGKRRQAHHGSDLVTLKSMDVKPPYCLPKTIEPRHAVSFLRISHVSSYFLFE